MCYLALLEIQNADYCIKKSKKIYSEGIVKFCLASFSQRFGKQRSVAFKRYSSLKNENNSVICTRESSAEVWFITNKMNHNARYWLFKALK